MWDALWWHTPEWYSAVLAIIGILWWAVVVPAFKAIRKTAQVAPVVSNLAGTLAEIKGSIQELHTEVADIKKEVTFNSGGSMKDAVSRTEQQVVQNNLDLKEQTKNLTGQIRAVKTETAKATKHAKKNSQRITVLEKKS